MAADDTLKGGGAGNDDMSGGEGRDTFSFDLASAQDTIADFQFGVDEFEFIREQTIATL